MWSPLLAELAKDRVVLAPDLKGMGASEVRPPYDVDTLAAELAALVLHEVDGPVGVVGHDWGGSLAIALATHRPDLVSRLVVINAPYRQVDLRRAWYIPATALPVLPGMVLRTAGDWLLGKALDAGWKSSTPLSSEARSEYVAAYDDPRRQEALLGYYRASVRRRLGKRTSHSAPDVPALVVWGELDPVLPLRIGEGVARDLAAELVRVPGAGHFVVDEAPELVIPAVAGFLRAA
jgi:pimeloyl-ACP methyl ester carboxylesterase